MPPPPPVDDGETDTAWDFPTRSVVAAAQAQTPRTTAASSIFGMADAIKAAKDLQRRGRFGEAGGFLPSTPAPTVTREGGVVRVVGAAYPAGRMTEAREEAEKQRRARQKPPKPTRRARTKGKKLRDLIGDDDYGD